MGVSHGPVPALAYRIDLGEQRIVFSGDLNGDDPWAERRFGSGVLRA